MPSYQVRINTEHGEMLVCVDGDDGLTACRIVERLLDTAGIKYDEYSAYQSIVFDARGRSDEVNVDSLRRIFADMLHGRDRIES